MWLTFVRVSPALLSSLRADADLARSLLSGEETTLRRLGVSAQDVAGMSYTSLVIHDLAWQRTVRAQLSSEGLDPDEAIELANPFTRSPITVSRSALRPSPDQDLERDLGAAGALDADAGFGPAVYLDAPGVLGLRSRQPMCEREDLLDRLIGRTIEGGGCLVAYVS